MYVLSSPLNKQTGCNCVVAVDALSCVFSKRWTCTRRAAAAAMTRTSLADITHCIFDVDGLMLDTAPLFWEANVKVLSDFDIEFDPAWSPPMAGRNAPEAVEILLRLSGLSDRISVAEYIRRSDQHLPEILPKAQLKPGVERLMRHLHAHKVPIAICTGSRQFTFDLKMRSHTALMQYVSHTVLAGSDPDVKRGKPAPDPFLVCLSRFHPTAPPPASRVLVFEDAPNGVESARAAGMHVVMVPDQQFAKLPDLGEGADTVLPTMEAFRPELFGLPAFE